MTSKATPPAPCTIWWIRRDLRLADNAALASSLEATPGGYVLPVFILDPALLTSEWVGEKRIAFLYAGLRALDGDLRARGSRLIVRRGEPSLALGRLCAETGASSIWAERDHSPFAKARDARIAALLPLRLVDGLTVHPTNAVRKPEGTPYTVFTPYSKAWKGRSRPDWGQILAPPALLKSCSTDIMSEPLPAAPAFLGEDRAPAGEVEAQRRLSRFAGGQSAPMYDYANTRNRPDLDGTSQLSPYLRFGMISARTVALNAYEAIARAPDSEAARSAEAWLNELIWREFYIQILDAFPHVRSGAMRPDYDKIEWIDDDASFAAWCDGRTGYPIVDAAMRQLKAAGWMHNRLRMVVASFLVKDLLIDWRKGERWFMQHLLDGDPAANNGGWQWSAGVGADAAPYFRIFNPISQGTKFDPHGAYVRRWIPELADVSDASVHQPWMLSIAEQKRAGLQIGVDYPAPIVDHAFARARVLAAFAAVRDAA